MNTILLIGGSILILISVLVSKISDRFGIPALLLFLVIGMLAGSDGPGGLYFDDPALAQSIGLIAMILIMFSGGLDTKWKDVRLVLKEGLLLSTLGVLTTALVVGLFTHLFMGFTFLQGMLLGSIISSTDAAAVFSILRSKNIRLKNPLKPLLELESGSNDPMAIFLTIGLIQLIENPNLTFFNLLGLFLTQMLVGALIGFCMGHVMLFIINRIHLGYEGLYPVLTLSLMFLTFGIADRLQGSGYLAVYLAGIVLVKHDFIHKRSLLRFHDGLAWLMQIAMFLTLGLLVFPSQLMPVSGMGLLVALCLMLVARPISIFVGLLPSRLDWREKVFISWVGLRGAVPIILATFPLLAGVQQAQLFFNVVFFVVLTSVLLQGTSIPLAARWLKVEAPPMPAEEKSVEYAPDSPMSRLNSEVKELTIPTGSAAAGKAIVELNLHGGVLVILVMRGDEFLIPNGSTRLQGGDTLLLLADKKAFLETQAKFSPAI
jgi:cell volume regulation protein A